MTVTPLKRAAVDTRPGERDSRRSWTNASELVQLIRNRDDKQGVTPDRTSPTTTTEPRSYAERPVTATRYVLPLARYERAWTVEEIQQ